MRQIVSGIRQWYTPEDMVGKTIIVCGKPETREDIRNASLKACCWRAKRTAQLKRIVTMDGDAEKRHTGDRDAAV